MQKQNAFILALVMMVIGFIGGLGFAAFKGAPPGLESAQAPMPSTPQGMPGGMPGAEENPQLAANKAKLFEAEERLRTAPDNVELLIQAGNFAFDAEIYDRAIEHYNKGLELGGENANVPTDCAIAYRRVGDSKKALDYLRRARKADPNNQNAALNLGIILFHDFQDTKAAVEVWKEYLALNPKGQRAEMIKRTIEQIEAGVSGMPGN